jgi:hypothetical protein
MKAFPLVDSGTSRARSSKARSMSRARRSKAASKPFQRLAVVAGGVGREILLFERVRLQVEQ